MRFTALLLLALASGAQETPTFKTRVSLVHVDAEVVGEDGRIVTGFTKDDFRVLDQGKEQPILHFSSGEDPLDLILLFDISGSMKPKVQEVAAAAREGVQELRQGDRVAIMVFNTHTRLVLPFTNDLERVQQSIRSDILALPFGGGTFIQSAVSDAAKRFLREPRTARRRAVLIITDDMGMRTQRESSVVRELWEADALLSGLIVRAGVYQAVNVVSTIMNPSRIAMQAGVRGIAAKTGGDFIPSGDPAAGFQESMRRIRNRYTIYYAMPEAKPKTQRTVRVELTSQAAKQHSKAKVRARTGYFTPDEGPSADRP
jgi:VWFA-related protein